jgi:glycolate oxidase FAD binding subunit
MNAPLNQITDQIHTAIAAKKPLCIRGGGSKDFFGGVLQGDLLDTTALNGIVNYEPSELVVTVRAGTPLAELEAALAEKGQCLPFEPPHFGNAQATVGGMVAAGLAGPARVAVGGVRDYVLGLELLNGRAELLRFGGTVMKNVAGYDVSRLMVGAMGTLGLITEVSLKVLPVATAEATLRFVMDEASAIHQLNTWAGQPLPLNASSWVIDAGVPTLHLRLRGAVAAVEAACVMFTARHGGVRVDSPATRADWSAARDLKLPWFAEGFKRGQDLWRVGVPPTAAPLNLGDTMIDWLGGQRWLWLPPGDATGAQNLVKGARGVGGNASLFIASYAHNPRPNGQNGLKPSDQAVAGSNQAANAAETAIAAISRRLKDEFDPSGVFNRGRLVAG